MSRFIDMLKQAIEGKAQRIGFGAALVQVKRRPLLLMAKLDGLNSQLASDVANRGADAVVLPIRSAEERRADANVCCTGDLDAVKAALGDTPWGALSPSFSSEDVEKLKELGCDFVVFEAEKTPSALLEETIGKVLVVTPAISDVMARMVDQLPVDAVLLKDYASTEPYVTVQQLMDFRRIMSLSRKPLIISVAEDYDTTGLRNLRDAGIGGIIFRVIDADSAERLKSLHEAIQALPASRKRTVEREAPVLPQVGAGPAAFEEEEEEEEE